MHGSSEVEALKGRYLLEDQGTNCRILVKWILGEKCGAGYGPVEDSVNVGCVKGGIFLESPWQT